MKKKSKALKKYTAFIPKTLKATRNLKSGTVKRFKYFLKKGSTTIKNTAKFLNQQTAKTLRSLSMRRMRK
jgi:hypothetical protein